MNLVLKASVLGVITTVLLAGAGCSAEPEDGTEEGDLITGAATPRPNDVVFEQVKTCDNLFKDRALFRQADLDEGVLRWKCGDVDGVTISKCEDALRALADEEMTGVKTLSPADRATLAKDEVTRKTDVTLARRSTLRACGEGYGQEYCEYNAISKGNIVNTAKSAKALKDADEVQCVFTSVQSDFKGTATTPEKFADELASKVKPLLSSAERTPEGRATGMKQGVNSRGAADTLILDCANLAKGGATSAIAKDADRQVLCYNAWAKGTTAEKTKLEKACKGVDLSNDAAWAKVGIKATELNDTDRDLAACTMVLKAEHGGVSWRNSDPTICARSYRAARECNVTFKKIGAVAPAFPGFSMQGWSKRDALPQGCKYAAIDNKPNANVVICTAGAQDVKNYRTQKKDLQTLCRDKFGVNVAMQAPVGALANLSAAKEETPFCKSFVAGAKKAQKPASPAKE